MASRNHHRNDGNSNKGNNANSNRTQKTRFVPKAHQPSSSQSAPPIAAVGSAASTAPFTNSLRETAASWEKSDGGVPSSKKADGSSSTAAAEAGSSLNSSSSSSSLRGEVGKRRDLSRNRERRFVNYLPQDEAVAIGLGVDEGGLDPEESQKAVDLLNDELGKLLKLSPRQFWKEVSSDSSLQDFLDSFLRFRHRWYDFPHHKSSGMIAGVIVGEVELSRRVFLALYRISSNKDPDARASDSLSQKDHTAILQERKLLDLPKLLDICAIYGQENQELTRLLIVNTLKSQPWLLDNLTEALGHLLRILHTMWQRCSSFLEVLFASGVDKDNEKADLLLDFLEVMDFVNDAVSTLNAFIDAYKPAAAYFSFPVETSLGTEELLVTLSKLHDSFLPSLERGFSVLASIKNHHSFNSTADSYRNATLCLKLLLSRIVKLGWTLIEFSYLNNTPTDDSDHLLRSPKMFPAKIEDPGIRGDILVQTLRELNSNISYDINENHGRATFIQALQSHYKIMAKLENLGKDGWIFLDNEQWWFLESITTRGPLKPRAENKSAPTPSTNYKPENEDDIILESKISQIKDLFPDYGKGFLTACLEVYNHDAEEVIQRILEGTLHPDLASLDMTMENVPPRKPVSQSKKDKGKGILEESVSRSDPKAHVGTHSHIDSGSRGSTSRPVLGSDPEIHAVLQRSGQGSSLSSSAAVTATASSTATSTYGRFTRKQKDAGDDSIILDAKKEKDSIRQAVIASQYEYEDEYDDSFDELGFSVAESSIEETEILGSQRSLIGEKFGQMMMSDTAGKDSNSRWNKKTPQFYVKDGKNYSYKVTGGVAMSDAREAAEFNQTQREMIHGLGRGGNIPYRAAQPGNDITSGEGMSQEEETVDDTAGRGGRGGNRSARGRGRRGGWNHHQQDRAMRKHMSGLTGL